MTLALPELMFFFFFFLRFYFFIHERHRKRERQRHRQKEKRAPRREPDVGLNPGTPGSPELKADAQPLSHPGVPVRGLYVFWRLAPYQICDL